MDVGNLLGFLNDRVRISVGATVYSDDIVNINRGLRYINISCNLVNKSKNIDEHGKISSAIISLPIPTDQSLFGTVKRYVDIERAVPIYKSSIHHLEFTVMDQDYKPINIGDILLELNID